MRPASIIAIAASLWAVPTFAALTIQFDYTYDNNSFFSNAAAKTALESAASRFTSFTDTLSAITPGGGNTWTAQFFNPANPASNASISNATIAQNTIVVYVGGAALGGSTLGQGGPGGYSASGYPTFFNSLARGQGVVQGASATDFAAWGGSISFNSTTSWYFGAGTPGTGQSSFLSVAEHELAHVLGFGTADSWNNLLSGSTFTGTTAETIYGGAVPVAPSTDLAHWNYGITSVLPGTRIGQETAMDPDITIGTSKDLTVLDYAGLKDIGWQVPQDLLSVPEPTSVMTLIGLTGAALSLRPRRRRAA